MSKIYYYDSEPKVLDFDLTDVEILYVQEERMKEFKELNPNIDIFRAYNFKTIKVQTVFGESPDEEPFEPLILTISAGSKTGTGIYYYSGTFCSPYDFIVPEGLEFYISESTQGYNKFLSGSYNLVSQLYYTKVGEAGDKLPANVGYYVRAVNSGNYTIQKANSEQSYPEIITPELLESNIFVGTTEQITVTPRTICVFGLDSKTRNLGFWPYNGSTVAANKSYIPENKLQIKDDKHIITYESNPALMVCMYKSGLAENPMYMTLAEARAVTNADITKITDVGQYITSAVFCARDTYDSVNIPRTLIEEGEENTWGITTKMTSENIHTFNEFKYFTGVTSVSMPSGSAVPYWWAYQEGSSFWDADDRSDCLKEITFPYTLTEIGGDAFQFNCPPEGDGLKINYLSPYTTGLTTNFAPARIKSVKYYGPTEDTDYPYEP